MHIDFEPMIFCVRNEFFLAINVIIIKISCYLIVEFLSYV